MRLTQAQNRARQQSELAATGSGDPETVAATVAGALNDAIRWDGFRILTIDPDTLGVNRLLAASAHDGEMRQRWLRDAYKRDVNIGLGPFQQADRIRSGFRAIMIHERLDSCYGVTPAIRSAIDDQIFYRRYHEHRERFHPGFNLVNAILVNFSVGSRWVATMQAYRIDSVQSFTQTDPAFIRLVAPRAGEAIDAAFRRERLAHHFQPVPGGGTSGILIVDRTDGVRYASAAGRAWLEKLRRLPADQDTLLPTSIWSAIAGVATGDAVTRTRSSLPVGMVDIEASPGGPDGSVVLVISAPKAESEMVVPSAWGLTPVEERVVGLTIRGDSNRQISGALDISEHTVEWHLRKVFARLDIRSRSQLATRLLADAGLPSSSGPTTTPVPDGVMIPAGVAR